MEKTLLSPRLDVGFIWLVQVGGLAQILPIAQGLSAERANLICTRLDATEHDTTSRWAVLLLSLLSEGDWLVDPGALASHRRAVAIEVAEEFRFSNKDRKSLAVRVEQPLNRNALAEGMTLTALRRFYADSPNDAWSRISVAQALADGDEETLQTLGRLKQDLSVLLDSEDPVPKLPSGLGALLSKEFSLKGRAIGTAMHGLCEAIFEGHIPNHASREEFVAYFRTMQESESE
ncbi:MAG: hypothetical protein ACJAYU_005200 [Bradymonadia bacterium]|jgi:hypothetical protein